MGRGKIIFDKQIRVIMDFKVLTKKNNCSLQLSGWGLSNNGSNNVRGHAMV